jgi:hypothetical protein
VDTAQTERIISLIDYFVASKKVSPELKRYILDEFKGEIVGHHSLDITQCRCSLSDSKKRKEDRWHRAVKEFVHDHELEWIDIS